MRDRGSPRVLIFIVAYNAERTIDEVIRRIPAGLHRYDTHILVIDDSSQDRTFERAHASKAQAVSPFPVTVLYNPANQGYGGNQKIGFHYAIREGFDAVVLLHGDGQYAPERMPALIERLLESGAGAVFGSRMMHRFDALRGGMPFYKFIGNRILTGVQNRLLHSRLSEFHSGYRAYSVRGLAAVPFDRNTNDFHFDTEIVIQFFRAGLRIEEVPIPTYYGDEICHVNGMKYAWDVIKATLIARAQDLGILYERKFDVAAPAAANPLYQAKFGYPSPHELALRRVPAGAEVLDIGCASGYVSKALTNQGCRVTGLDQYSPADTSALERFVRYDLDQDELPLDAGQFDYVLLLDVIEHLRSPEKFVESIRASMRLASRTRVVFSTGNVAFILTRLMLLLGGFNYGVRGILDLTHTRLFTFASARNLFLQAGYVIEEVRGIPAPFPLAMGDRRLARILLALNQMLIRVSKTLFSYQIFVVARPLPTLETLLGTAEAMSAVRSSRIATLPQATREI